MPKFRNKITGQTVTRNGDKADYFKRQARWEEVEDKAKATKDETKEATTETPAKEDEKEPAKKTATTSKTKNTTTK